MAVSRLINLYNKNANEDVRRVVKYLKKHKGHANRDIEKILLLHGENMDIPTVNIELIAFDIQRDWDSFIKFYFKISENYTTIPQDKESRRKRREEREQKERREIPDQSAADDYLDHLHEQY